ncbi:protein of unknown function [Methanoculleus bourgensis]|uniref:Uncharacterized protein n=1 Tax=Methanoculleus bourgensis TaxID=83986 RepID=A0A0X3BJ99_9EURY|nr:protein of unknown function [Methanoculleus bourgensis]
MDRGDYHPKGGDRGRGPPPPPPGAGAVALRYLGENPAQVGPGDVRPDSGGGQLTAD